MSAAVEWWMYLAHAFTPMMLLLGMPALMQARQGTASNGEAGTASETTDTALPQVPVSAVNSKFAVFASSVITQLLLTAIFYGLWLAAHWLVFWFLNKPFNVDAYFYKPAHLAYWFPYLFGAVVYSYYALAGPLLNNQLQKNLLHGIIVTGALASTYMVFVTYLAWLLR